MTLSELCEKDVINVSTGVNWGRVDDLVFDPEHATVTHVVLYGRLKFFGLLGREQDSLIPREDIQKIGDDVLLVDTVAQIFSKQRTRLFNIT